MRHVRTAMFLHGATFALIVVVGATISGCSEVSLRPRATDGSMEDAGGPLDAAVPADAGVTPNSPADAALATQDAHSSAVDAGSPTPPVAPRVVASGGERLVDLFVTDAGILLVLQSDVVLLARDGTELARWDGPRVISAAAFDGALLGVADYAVLTAFTPDLTEVSATPLTEECAAAVMVSGHRFVCGPSERGARTWYTYDLERGAELARAPQMETHRPAGVVMVPVPGRDAFVSVGDTISPSDFYYFGVEASGAAVYVNESPYHGDFDARRVLAFQGVPATHLVTHAGILLRIGDACIAGVPDAECFVRDGLLGIAPAEQLTAMANDADGGIYGLLEPIGSYVPGDPACTHGCSVVRFDVASHTIRSEGRWMGPATEVVALRHDPWTSSLLLGFEQTCERRHVCRDWVVARLSYGDG